MARPEVGAAPRRFAECGGWAYGGAPACGTCRDLVDGIVDDEWRAFLRDWDVRADAETALAEMVVGEPHRHEWPIVDAAFDRLVCRTCGERLSRGPVGCAACDQAHGFRYAAIETDRPGVPPGNEHAVRVNVSVVRRPGVTSANELEVRSRFLPVLLAGVLPTNAEAQRMSALIRNGAPAQRPALIERAVEDLFRRRPGT